MANFSVTFFSKKTKSNFSNTMPKFLSQYHLRKLSVFRGFFCPDLTFFNQKDLWIKKIFLVLLLFLFSQTNITPLYAEEAMDREYTIKAGMLLKFTEFIKWPEIYSSISVEEPINICLQGKDRFGDLFDYVNDHAIIRRNILIRRSVPINHLSSCHILYVNDLEDPDLENVGDEIEGTPLLVIAQTEGSVPPWVAINFRNINNNIKFEINRAALERSGLSVSSELLNLALTVLRAD